VKEFELGWQEEDKHRKSGKPSSRLLQLSRREKYLARLNHFNDAELTKREAHELTGRELWRSQAMVNCDFHLSREKLREKQQAELDLLIATRKHWRECLLVRQKAERKVLKNLENAVEQRQKEPCRTREAQLPTMKTRTIGTAQSKRFDTNAEISFEYVTVLPPVHPPDEIERAVAREGRRSPSVQSNDEEEEKGVIAHD
jgi:hypothetical protein